MYTGAPTLSHRITTHTRGGAVEGLANTEELAEYLGVKPQTLANWAYQGRGPTYVKVNGLRKYDWADVREWVEARKVRH